MIRPETDVSMLNRHGDTIHATITMPETQEPVAAVILVHGFKGFRNWSFLPLMAQEAASRSLIGVRIDLSLNGMQGTNDRVQDGDAFARNTVTREVDDVHDALHQLGNHLGSRWNGVVHLMGHSRGGGVIHVVMRELAEQQRPDIRLGRGVALNSIGTWVRWTPRQRPLFIEAGFTEFENQRTGQRLRMNVDYMYDIEQNLERLDLVRAASSVADHLMYVHAEQDLTVPLSEHNALRTSASSCGPLTVISRTTHTFGMTHPITHVTEPFVSALHHSFAWITNER